MRVPGIKHAVESMGAGRRWIAGGGMGLIVTAAILSGGMHVSATDLATCSSGSQVDNCLFGGFEIDGNTYDGQGGTDWQSSAVYGSDAYTPFYDLFNTTSDNIMSNGSKESDQSTWSCVTSKAPGKSDLGAGFYTATTPTGDPGGDPGVTAGEFAPKSSVPWAGSIWFENTTKQYLFGNFQRYATNGDVHLDYEFNKATTKLSSGCTSLPKRSQGDVLVTFDTSNGGAQIFVSAFVWNCSPLQTKGTVCTGGGSFATATGLTAGGTFAGMANIPSGDNGVTSGAYGEAGLNLTDTIGDFTCGQFGSAFMKTRSAGTSDLANGKAEVKDFTTPVPFNPGLCPVSTLAKYQADETTQNAANNTTEGTEGSDGDGTDDASLTYNQNCSAADHTAGTCASGAGTTPMAANPGDQISYKLVYQNTGGGSAPNPVVTDTIPSGKFADNTSVATTYVASSQSCPTDATCIAASSSTYNSTTPCSSTNAGVGETVTKLVWCLPAEAASASVDLYFEVDVPSTASESGTLTIENHGSVTDTQVTSDTGSDSNFVASAVAYAPDSLLVKKEADVQPLNQYCNTASGGATSSNATCNSLAGTLVTDPTFLAGPISATPGDILKYQLTYTNQSSATSPATNVVISDSIPVNATYVANSAAGAGSPTIACLNGSSVAVACATATSTVATITWTYASVAIGASDAVTFEVKVASTFPGTSGNSVCTPLNTFTSSQVDNCATVVTDQDTAKSLDVLANVSGTGVLQLVKSAAVTGNSIVYTIKYFNIGTQDLTGITITDLIPAGLTYDSCGGTPSAGSCSNNAGTVTWTGLSAAAGTTAASPAGTVTLTVHQ